MDDRYLETEKQYIELKKEYTESAILDIGGGGEGFVGKLYGRNVIAIDAREDELLETNNHAIKLVMDGRDLKFTEENFDVVTLFYSLMYMKKDTKEKVLSEAYRVLKKGGIIDIWDAEVPIYKDDGKDIFVVQLSVDCIGETTSTGYGILLDDNNHTKDSVETLLMNNGFSKVKEEECSQSFRLQYKKN